MARLLILATLLLVALPHAPVAGQAIPDRIPDEPGTSLADREKERFIERNRGLLSRLFTMTAFDVAPLADPGPAYQASMRLGLEFPTGDAMFVALSARQNGFDPEAERPGGDGNLGYVGAGVAVSGTRFLGASNAGYRSALNAELGWWPGGVSVVAFDLAPTYDILAGHSWSVPAGVRLSVARIEGDAGVVVRPFAGLTLGARWHPFARDRLRLK